MNLMLLLIIVCITIGLLSQRIGQRQYAAVAVAATIVTTLYFAFLRFL